MSRYKIDDAPDPYQQRVTLLAQVAFLTARYDAAEALWRQADAEGLLLEVPGAPVVWADEATPRQFLADIAAKRAIVGHAKTAAERTVRVDQTQRAMMIAAFVEVLTTVVATMVQPYAEHPDFDPAWRVE